MKNNKQRLFELMEMTNTNFTQAKPKLIFTVGISGSGKSTWINSLSKNDYVIVSFDNLRRELTGDVNDHSTSEEVRAIAYKRIIDALNAGKNVVLDALNVSSRGRRKNIEYIKDNTSTDFDLYAKIFALC